MIKHSEKFLRHRKLLTMAPLLIAPCLTMLFWSLGGGTNANGTPPPDTQGLNTEIPNAQIKDNSSAWDKYALYEKAKRDSLRKAEAERTDPYFRLRTITEVNRKDSIGSINSSLGKKDFRETDDEVAIDRRIAEINSVINAPANSKNSQSISDAPVQPEVENPDPSIDRLEQMMLMMQSEGQADPEMENVESVLDKILDVQHPDRVRQRIEQQSFKEQGKVFPVSKHLYEEVVNSFGSPNETDSIHQAISFTNGLLDHDISYEANLIKAALHGDQVLTAGSVVKLALIDEVYINGKKIDRGTFLFGTCTIQNERVIIGVQSILSNGALIPVSLSVHDLDGIEGLYTPGSTVNDATRQGSDQLLQGVQLMSLDPSIGAQAASAGIQTAKTLFTRKNRVVRVHINSGYNVFLNDTSKKSKSFK